MNLNIQSSGHLGYSECCACHGFVIVIIAVVYYINSICFCRQVINIQVGLTCFIEYDCFRFAVYSYSYIACSIYIDLNVFNSTMSNVLNFNCNGSICFINSEVLFIIRPGVVNIPIVNCF